MNKAIAVVVSGVFVFLQPGVSFGAQEGRTPCGNGRKTSALDGTAWAHGEWISAKGAAIRENPTRNIFSRLEPAAEGTVRFEREVRNARRVVKAVWMTSALGVMEIYVNGRIVGEDVLRPGFTQPAKRRQSFTYDVTDMMRTEAGATNVIAADVSAGWWRDQVVQFVGRRSAFRAVLELAYDDGSREWIGTSAEDWKGTPSGPVRKAGIYDGETYDARVRAEPRAGGCERNDEFAGVVTPGDGAEVWLRRDLALKPVSAWCWRGAEGAVGTNAFGKVRITRRFGSDEFLSVAPGETLVVDFGQNAAAIPEFDFAAEAGTTLVCLPGEMLNDGNGERSRGNDGPAGSIYRENLRIPGGVELRYTFAANEGPVRYAPHFTFFGYRYLSISADGPVVISRLRSVPVTSISREMETGELETGDAAVNRLIANCRWGQLSNYLSVPTDCPQRNERLGWSADTQIFAEAGTYNADTLRFLGKWLADLRDGQEPGGGFPSVAPWVSLVDQPYRFGWSDAGVIVPWTLWKQFGERRVVDDNWAAMERYMDYLGKTRYDLAEVRKTYGKYQFGDWLAYEKPCDYNFLSGCYWLMDAGMMRDMARGTGRAEAVVRYEKMVGEATAYMRDRFCDSSDGMLVRNLRGLQAPALFALKLGLVEGAAHEATVAELRKNFTDHGGCLQTGFLSTSVLMDTLTENGLTDVAYDLLFQRKCPSWLYSVDQGATTIWERWNSYTRDEGFGPVNMNSFNHYAYGAVLAWLYKTAAGIAADVSAPGFRKVVMRPVPDRRLGWLKASYRSAAGLIRSVWRYEGDEWIWDFEIPSGATAVVTLPGEETSVTYGAGLHTVRRSLPSQTHPAGTVRVCGAVRPKMELAAPGAVRPTGWLRDVAEAQRDGCTGRMDEVDVQFRRAWRESSRPRGKDMWWSADPGAWSCEGGAYWFDGLVRLAWQLDDGGLKDLVAKRLDTVLTMMSDDAIGFCWWLDRNDPVHVRELRDSDCWLIWVTGMFERPVGAWYRATGDGRAAKALGSAFGNGLFDFGEYPTTPSGAYDAYRLTGDKRIAAALDGMFGRLEREPDAFPRVFAQYAARPGRFLEETLSIKRRHQRALGLPTRHGVIASESLLSVFCGYLWTGNTNWLDAVRGWYGFFDRHLRQPYGVSTMDEEWGYPGPGRGTETCVVAAESWARINLLAALGEGKWGDDVERAFFNAAPNCVTPDFRQHVYMQQPNRTEANDLSDCSFSGDPGEFLGRYDAKHWPLCCTAALNRILPDYVQAMWMTSADGGVAAALYGPCTFCTDLRCGRMELEERTDYPFGETVTIVVKTAPDGEVPVRMRLPVWCASAEVRLNGASVDFVRADGFARIARRWRAGDTLSLRFPMRPTVERMDDYTDRRMRYGFVSLGPLLFAKDLTGADANAPVGDVRAPTLAADAAERIGVMRTAMPAKWSWNAAESAIRLTVPAADGEMLELVPYGCAKMRISLFPEAK